MILLHRHICGGARISPPLSLLCVVDAGAEEDVVVAEAAVVLVAVVVVDVDEEAFDPAVEGFCDGFEAAIVWTVVVEVWAVDWVSVSPFCFGETIEAFTVLGVLVGGETFEANEAGVGLIPLASGSDLNFVAVSCVLSDEVVVNEVAVLFEDECIEAGKIPLLCISLYFSLCSIFKVR